MAPRRSQWGRYPRVRTVVSASPGCATSLIAFFSSGNAVLPGRPGWKPGVQTMARLEAGGTDDGPAGSRGYKRWPGWKPGGQTTARLEAGVQTMARLEAGGTDDGPAGGRGDRRRPGWKPGVQTAGRVYPRLPAGPSPSYPTRTCALLVVSLPRISITLISTVYVPGSS